MGALGGRSTVDVHADESSARPMSPVTGRERVIMLASSGVAMGMTRGSRGSSVRLLAGGTPACGARQKVCLAGY
jgi:hypothetical protein